MWIIKILFVISPIIATRADVNELQNTIDNGYSYDRPETIPAEFAFYLNVPGGHDPNSYISKNEGHYNQQQQFSGGNPSRFRPNHNHQGHFNHHHQQHYNEEINQNLAQNHGLSLNYNYPKFSELLNQYTPPTPTTPNLPFIQQNSGFRPITPVHQQQDLPFIQELAGLRLINSLHQQQSVGYNQHQFSSQQHHQHQHSNGPPPPQQNFQNQIEPRNLNHVPQNSISFHQQQTPLQFQQKQNSPIPSQELQPPPSFNNPISPSTISSNQQPQAPNNNRFMASISNSLNAPLPFPFGVVPIKFDPLPLKTHLRQEKLLPITSYEAKLFHKK